MTLDALATEPHFLDHLAPVWRALPQSVRGRFLVDALLLPRAVRYGIAAEAVDAQAIRDSMGQQPPVFGGKLALTASIGDIKVARRLGYGPFAFLEHGIGQSYGSFGARANGSYSGGGDRDDNELFLVPGPDPAKRWRDAYPDARVEEVGSPRLDDLPRRVPDGRTVVALSFHWPAPLSISGYAGTALGDFLPALPVLARRFDVIGHAHPNWYRRGDGAAAKFAKAGIPFVRDFDDVCRQADVYVCDNSSTIYEFAATGRPVVLLNARQWSRKGPELGLRFWAASHVGINVDRPEDLIPAVERSLEHRSEDIAAREDALELVYTYRYGAAERAAAVIVDWLGSRQEVAA